MSKNLIHLRPFRTGLLKGVYFLAEAPKPKLTANVETSWLFVLFLYELPDNYLYLCHDHYMCWVIHVYHVVHTMYRICKVLDYINIDYALCHANTDVSYLLAFQYKAPFLRLKRICFIHVMKKNQLCSIQ